MEEGAISSDEEGQVTGSGTRRDKRDRFARRTGEDDLAGRAGQHCS